jgi:hypothetical protein
MIARRCRPAFQWMNKKIDDQRKDTVFLYKMNPNRFLKLDSGPTVVVAGPG